MAPGPEDQIDRRFALTECARCRQPWNPVLRICAHCGWAPVGAHLPPPTARRKKKALPWLDPSRSTVFAVLVLLVLTVWGLTATGLIQEGWERIAGAKAIPDQLCGAWQLRRSKMHPEGRLVVDSRGRAKLETDGLTLFGRAAATANGIQLIMSSFAESDGETTKAPVVRPFIVASGETALIVDPKARLNSDEQRIADAAVRAEGFLSESGLAEQVGKIEGLMNEEP